MQSFKEEQINIAAIIFKIAHRCKDRTAIIELNPAFKQEKAITYAEFIQKTKQYSEHLSNIFGVSPQAFIGLNLPKGIDYFAYLVAIWKAGHVYVPLPQYLPDLSDRADTINVDAIITDSDSLSMWTKQSKESLQRSTSLGPYRILHREHVAAHGLEQSKPAAYIINTSGTSGVPKSIVIGHQGLVNMAESSVELMQMQDNQDYRILLRSNLEADPSLFEFLLGMLSGATCFSFQEPMNTAYAVECLPKIIVKNNINVLLCPPDRLSMYHRLAKTDDWCKKFPQTLKRLLSTTDKVSQVTLDYYARVEGCLVFDGYGPTETTVGLMIKESSKDKGAIGRAGDYLFRGMELMLIRDDVSISSGTGELCASGPGLMLGYCHHGTLTPISELKKTIFYHNQKLFYRTGDEVSIDATGLIVFKRRLEGKKLSGIKSLSVEYIRDTLTKLCGVDVAVLQSKKFKGYEVFCSQNRLTSDIVDQVLILANGFKIPSCSYLVTQHDVEAINCKGDLPGNASAKLQSETIIKLPESEIQKQFSDIVTAHWSTSLRGLPIDDIDPNVSFLHYGGDSEAVIFFLSLINSDKRLGIHVSVRFFTTNMTLAQFIYFALTVQAWTASLCFDGADLSKKTLIYFPPLAGDTYHNFDNVKAEIGHEINHLVFKCPLLTHSTNSVYGHFSQAQCEHSLQKNNPVPFKLDHVAKALANIIVTKLSVKSCYFIGYSFGGLLALATARELNDQQIDTEYLGLVDSQAPKNQAGLPLEDHVTRLKSAVTAIIKSSLRDERVSQNKEMFCQTVNETPVSGTHRSMIHSVMRPLLSGIELSKVQLSSDLKDSLNILQNMLHTAYYHFLLAIDYEPDADSNKLKNINCYFAGTQVAGRQEATEEDWQPYCVTRTVIATRYADRDHGNMLAADSTVLKDIRESVSKPTEPMVKMPSLLGYFPPVFSFFTGRVDVLEQLDAIADQANVTSSEDCGSGVQIIGTGGLGKTQLLNYFARRMVTSKKYAWAVWLQINDTESQNFEEVVLSQIDDIANILRIDTQRFKGKNLVREVFTVLSASGRGLIVYDDVDDYTNIISYLPSTYNVIADIYISTKNNEVWDPSIDQIQLGVFSLDEARSYISAVLKKREVPSESAEKLSTLLGFCPLALTQALAYIAQPPAITVEAYCQEFSKSKLAAENFLKNKPFKSDSHQETIWLTVVLSLERINNPNSELFLKLLSYYAPEMPIETSMLVQSVPDKNLIADEACRVLLQYSLVSPSQVLGHVSVHSIVQTVMRVKPSEKNESDWICNSSGLIIKHCQVEDEPNARDIRNKYALPHMMSLCEQLSHYKDNQQVDRCYASLQSLLVPILIHAGRERDAVFASKQAIETLTHIKDVENTSDKELLVAELRRGTALLHAGANRESCKLLEKIYTEILKLPGHSRLLGNCLQIKGVALYNLYQLDKAIDCLTQAKEIARLHRDNFSDIERAFIDTDLASALDKNGKHHEAIRLFEEAMPTLTESYHTDNPRIAFIKNNYALALEACGNYTSAQQSSEQARVLFEQTFGNEHITTARANMNHAVSLMNNNSAKEAVALLKKSLNTFFKEYGNTHIDTMNCKINLAAALRLSDKQSEAKVNYFEVLDIISTSDEYDSFHSLAARCHNGLGDIYSNETDFDRTIYHARLSLTHMENQFSDDHPDVHILRKNFLGILRQENCLALKDLSVIKLSDIFLCRANNYFNNGQIIDAEAKHREAISSINLEDSYGFERQAMYLFHYGIFLKKIGYLDKAKTTFESAVNLQERFIQDLIDQCFDSTFILRAKLVLLKYRRCFDLSNFSIDRHSSIIPKLLANFLSLTFLANNNQRGQTEVLLDIVDCCLKLNDINSARFIVEMLINIIEKSDDEFRFYAVIGLLSGKIEIAGENKNYKKAWGLFNFTYQFQLDNLVDGHLDTGYTLWELAMVDEYHGDIHEAQNKYIQVEKIFKKYLISTHPDLLRVTEQISNLKNIAESTSDSACLLQ